MKKLILVVGGVISTLSAVAGAAVTVVDCPKCNMRMKIAADGKSATINRCRLMDDNPTAEELARRVKAMVARAEKLLIKDDPNANARTRPLMGWSTWNTFAMDISEEVITSVAQAMATNGLKAAGYRYVNIDDAFFGGRDEKGNLKFHPTRFPNGLKGIVDTVHKLGMKPGIYSEAGSDTCCAVWCDDKDGFGAGLYGHDNADCNLFFNDLGFDFIKVDSCDILSRGLDIRTRYTEIANAIKATGRTDVRYNVCIGFFPGRWVTEIADSWRTTYDIRAKWSSIRSIILKNLYLAPFASPGHYNDMDMLEVGQLTGKLKTWHKTDEGITPEEEATHFGAWCIMSSPLVIGCDPRKMPESTLALVTNPYLIAMSQNDLGLQAEVARRDGDAYILVKDADERFGSSRYVALLNLGDEPREMMVRARDLDLGGRVDVLDLVTRADPGPFTDYLSVTLPAHGSKFYRLDAEKRLDRVVYEAEAALLNDFRLVQKKILRPDTVKDGVLPPHLPAGVHPAEVAFASGGVVVKGLGNGETNDLLWKDVKVSQDGAYQFAFDWLPTKENRFFFLQIDGGEKIRLEAKGGTTRTVQIINLKAGVHTLRLSNPTAWTPDFDRLTISLTPPLRCR